MIAELAPQTRWERLQGVLYRMPKRVARDAPRAVTTAVARVRRGWAPSDTWNLDRHLCRTLGEMLDYLAEHHCGWPQSDEFPAYADWAAALRGTSGMLLAYDPEDPDSVTNAQRALAWVADHLRDLWD